MVESTPQKDGTHRGKMCRWRWEEREPNTAVTPESKIVPSAAVDSRGGNGDGVDFRTHFLGGGEKARGRRQLLEGGAGRGVVEKLPHRDLERLGAEFGLPKQGGWRLGNKKRVFWFGLKQTTTSCCQSERVVSLERRFGLQ